MRQQQPLGVIRVACTLESFCLKQGCECGCLFTEKALGRFTGIDAAREHGDLTSKCRLTTDRRVVRFQEVIEHGHCPTGDGHVFRKRRRLGAG